MKRKVGMVAKQPEGCSGPINWLHLIRWVKALFRVPCKACGWGSNCGFFRCSMPPGLIHSSYALEVSVAGSKVKPLRIRGHQRLTETLDTRSLGRLTLRGKAAETLEDRRAWSKLRANFVSFHIVYEHLTTLRSIRDFL